MLSRRGLLVIGLLVMLPALLIACGNDPEPTPTPVAEASDETTQPTQLEPPHMVLNANGEPQPAVLGSFNWFNEQGMGAEVSSGGFVEESFEPTSIAAGEQVDINLLDGPEPVSMEMSVYPAEGNVGPVGGADGAIDAFRTLTDPIETESHTGPFSWTADVDPGTYYIHVNVSWDEPREAEYAFKVEVS